MITHKLATVNKEGELVDVFECEKCKSRWTEPNMINCFHCHSGSQERGGAGARQQKAPPCLDTNQMKGGL